MSSRVLVMGDNHGDTESLERVLDATAGERFDLAIHVGDLTDAVRAGRDAAADQIRAVAPYLDAIDERTRHGLVWVWGNRDHFGAIGADLDVGTELPETGTVTVGDTRFTSDPEAVTGDVVLVTHMEHWRLLDHFAGRAHFCGNTHLGRHLGNRLNAAFLQYTPRDEDEQRYGGYFIVELDAGGIADVEMHSIDSLERIECPVHGERGVQYHAAFEGCMYCTKPAYLNRELAASAFYGLTNGTHRDAVDAKTLLEYALSLWDTPPEGLQDEFRTYLETIEDDRYAPLTRRDDGQLAVAEKSYAF